MTTEELLQNPDFKEITALSHTEIKNFIVSEITENQGWSRIANMYQITGILAFVLGGFKAFMPFFLSRETIFLSWLGIGLVFTFTLLIVLHELIHAIAYKSVGAKKLSFGMNIRKFIFYVQADKQVINYKQFKIVALAPAVVISLLSVIGMAIFYTQPIFYFFIPIFAFHSLFCAGDFGLLCFFENRKELDIVTFDNKQEGKTYFYGKKNS